MVVLSDLADRCLLVVGSSGTGKSVVSSELYERVDRSKLKLDSITVSGLAKIDKVLNYNNATIVVDDLSRGQTEYSQIATVSVFSALCYSHSITKLTGQLTLNIQGFRGSAIINLQPLLLRKIARLPEFETDIRDKVIRYYHLRFPIEDNIMPPKFPKGLKLNYLDAYNLPYDDLNHIYYKKAFDNFRLVFTKARAREHLNAYLNASARLNDRVRVNKSDMWLIWQLSKNFRLENQVLIKSSLEGARSLDENIIPLLSALATYKRPEIKELTYRFGIKKTRLYEIIASLSDYVVLVNSRGRVLPTKTTKDILEEAGEW
jgi:ABC-type dipeptide/oligopeptide/nickel transport system ATPase component